MGINYGLNKVRFLAPVPAGSRVRLRSDLVDAKKVDDSTVDLTVRQTVELDGSDKPQRWRRSSPGWSSKAESQRVVRA